MTSTFDTNTRTRTIAASKATSAPGAIGSAKRVSTAFPQRLIILVLAVGAILLGLSAPVVHAAPDDGPGTEPGPPYASGGQTLQLSLPPVQASQNPVVFYGAETKKHVDLTWTPYKWGPVRLRFEAVGGPKYAGHGPAVDPSETDPQLSLEVTYGRTYQVWLDTPSLENEQVGPTLTITTVRVELASTNPPPSRVNPPSTPGDNPRLDPPGTQRVDPGAAARNTMEERTLGASQRDDSKKQ